MARLFLVEIKLAEQEELLKQEMTIQYDFNVEILYKEVDDCNLKFIDTAALKRFLNKNSVLYTNSTIVGIIRRIDLDADAKLSKREFFEAVLPLEGFTRTTHK
jgi:hypothetical protein